MVAKVLRDTAEMGRSTRQQRSTGTWPSLVRRLLWEQETRRFESSRPDVDRSSVVERLTVTQVVVGSIPIGHPVSLAQRIEHLVPDQKAGGSNPSRDTATEQAQVAQLAEASASGAESWGFESLSGYARVVQWQRQRFQKPYSAGSNPAASTSRVVLDKRGRMGPMDVHLWRSRHVAQLVERPSLRGEVGGSNPARVTCGISSIGRAAGLQPANEGFESSMPLNGVRAVARPLASCKGGPARCMPL